MAIYKEIDIVSAKPTLNERAGVEHFGIDLISPDENFNVNHFIKLYQKLYIKSQNTARPIVIVGGTSFYLKMLIDGISQIPIISEKTALEVEERISNLSRTYNELIQIDKDFMQNIKSSDRYRIQKALEIYLQTQMIPSEYFKQNPPKSIIKTDLPIYEIITEKDDLRKKIAQRTQNMIDDGLIDEIAYLENKYGRKPNSMKSIGIKETLNYLDGIYTKDMMKEKIIINTAKLAKRQKTFNYSQFSNKTLVGVEKLKNIY